MSFSRVPVVVAVIIFISALVVWWQVNDGPRAVVNRVNSVIQRGRANYRSEYGPLTVLDLSDKLVIRVNAEAMAEYAQQNLSFGQKMQFDANPSGVPIITDLQNVIVEVMDQPTKRFQLRWRDANAPLVAGVDIESRDSRTVVIKILVDPDQLTNDSPESVSWQLSVMYYHAVQYLAELQKSAPMDFSEILDKYQTKLPTSSASDLGYKMKMLEGQRQ